MSHPRRGHRSRALCWMAAPPAVREGPVPSLRIALAGRLHSAEGSAAMPRARKRSWRVILFTDQAAFPPLWRQCPAGQGHRLAALVTSAQRNRDFLTVAGNAGPGVAAPVPEPPRRGAEMRAP